MILLFFVRPGSKVFCTLCGDRQASRSNVRPLHPRRQRHRSIRRRLHLPHRPREFCLQFRMSQGTHYLHVFSSRPSVRPSVRFSLLTPTIRYWPDGHSLNKFTQSTRGIPHRTYTSSVGVSWLSCWRLLTEKHKDIYQRQRLNFLLSVAAQVSVDLWNNNTVISFVYFCLLYKLHPVADDTKWKVMLLFIELETDCFLCYVSSGRRWNSCH